MTFLVSASLTQSQKTIFYEAEVDVLTSSYAHVTTTSGQQVIVRNGYLPERNILTAAGPVAVRVPKVRDRSKSGIKFNSQLVPPYVRKTPRMAAALPWLYLKGISTGDMSEALQALLGDEAKGMSAPVVKRRSSVLSPAMAPNIRKRSRS